MTTATQQHTVRVSPATHRMLRQIAEETGEPMTTIVARAVNRYRRERFLEAMNEEFEKVMADPVARAEIEAEDRLWEATLMDGLEDEEPW